MRPYNNRTNCANCVPRTFDSKIVYGHVRYLLKKKIRILLPLQSPSWAKSRVHRRSAVQ